MCIIICMYISPLAVIYLSYLDLDIGGTGLASAHTGRWFSRWIHIWVRVVGGPCLPSYTNEGSAATSIISVYISYRIHFYNSVYTLAHL